MYSKKSNAISRAFCSRLPLKYAAALKRFSLTSFGGPVTAFTVEFNSSHSPSSASFVARRKSSRLLTIGTR